MNRGMGSTGGIAYRVCLEGVCVGLPLVLVALITGGALLRRDHFLLVGGLLLFDHL